jgi:hypothetical protein
MNILKNPETFPIQPGDIDASKCLGDSFDHMETEISATWLVRFAQARDKSWEPFSYEEISNFYSKRQRGNFLFNRLVDPGMLPPSPSRQFVGHLDQPVPVGGGWIVKGNDDKYYFTDDFVRRCLESGPKT